MKIFTAVVALCFLPVTGGAQNNAIDSLDKLIVNASSDTARINLLNKKLSMLGNINLDSAITLGKSTLQQAINIKYKKTV